MPKSVLRYLLDKVRYFGLETYLLPVLFFPNEEADGRDRVKQFVYSNVLLFRCPATLYRASEQWTGNQMVV